LDKSSKQSISAPQGVALYVGAVLGSGILILPGITAGIAGDDSLIAWIGMVLLSIPLACTFAYLSIEYPSSGGIATFANKAFGYYTGALSGWLFFIAGSFGQIIVSLTGGMYITFAFNLPNFFAYIIAVLLLIIATVGNYFGLKTSGKVQLVIAALTFFILLSTILLSLSHIQYNQLSLDINQGNIMSVGQSAMLIFWSFFGWEAISSLAPEFKKPRKRNIMFSTWGAICIVGILYIGIALAVVGTQSYTLGGTSTEQALNNASLAEVVRKVIGLNGAWITGIVALTICLGTTNAFIAGISRLGYSLAHDKLAPKWLDKYDHKNSVPYRSVLLVGLFSIVGVVVSFIFNISLDQLVFVPNSLAIATYVIGTAAGVKLIKHKLGKVLALLSCILCLAAYPFIGTSMVIPITVVMICLSYITWRKKKEKDCHTSSSYRGDIHD
jgi:amino acid efflux transporter